jgi:hypothetical protein
MCLIVVDDNMYYPPMPTVDLSFISHFDFCLSLLLLPSPAKEAKAEREERAARPPQ